MRLQVGERLLEQSLTILRRCGAGELEAGDRSRVVRIEHPAHSATARGYRVDADWLTELWERMATSGQRVVAQVHTHPGEAFHSPTDDRSPALSLPGFMSVVVPYYASGELDLDRWYLAQLSPDGAWEQLEAATVIT
jgi:proteasome lid subunit RPN8/RPN11